MFLFLTKNSSYLIRYLNKNLILCNELYYITNTIIL